MTADEYCNHLISLGLSLRAAGAALGVSERMGYHYAEGTYPVPATVAKLLRIYAWLGTTEPDMSKGKHR